MCIRRDTFNQVAVKRWKKMITAFALDLRSSHTALVEILSSRHQLAAESDHGGILLGRIAFGNHDDRRNAITRGGDGDRLAVIAAGRRNDACRHLPSAMQ